MAIRAPGHERWITRKSPGHERLNIIESPCHERLNSIESPCHERLITKRSPSHERLLTIGASGHEIFTCMVYLYSNKHCESFLNPNISNLSMKTKYLLLWTIDITM